MTKDIDDRSVVEEYQAGVSVTALARKHQCRDMRISDILKKNGVPVRRGPVRRFTRDDFCPLGLHISDAERGVRNNGKTFYCIPCRRDYQLNWYYENRTGPDYRKHASERVKAYAEQVDPESGLTRRLANRTKSPYAYLNYLLGKATRRDTYGPTTLVLEDLTAIWDAQGGRCAISGVRMTHVMGTGGRVDTNVSLDRIDSSNGYEPGNVQLVCAQVNIMKQKLTLEELREWCSLILANGT